MLDPADLGQVFGVMACIVYALFLSLSLGIIVTIVIPVGAYAIHDRPTKRAFLAIPSFRQLFVARDAGAMACLVEMLAMVVVVWIAAGITLYALWVSDGLGAFDIAGVSGPGDPRMHYISWPHFLTSVLSSGAAPVTPVSYRAMFVVGLFVLVCVTYAGALVEAMLRLVVPEPCAPGIQARPNSQYIARSVEKAVGWLREIQSQDGHWDGIVGSDPVALACCGVGLMAAGRTSSGFDLLARASVAGPGDHLGRIVTKLGRREYASHGADLDTDVSTLNADETFLAALVAEMTSQTTHDLERMLAPVTYGKWLQEYGPHWACFALVHDVLRSGAAQADAESALVCRISPEGSWYGDHILTSMAICAIVGQKAQPRNWGTVMDAANWLESVRGGESCQSIRRLETWDTAWALYVLRQYGCDYWQCKRGLDWLLRAFRRGKAPGWSWSTQSDLTCMDTSTLAYELLSAWPVADAFAVDAVTEFETLLSGRYRLLGQGLWPTFVWDNYQVEPCPVASARAMAVLPMSATLSPGHWDDLLRRVRAGWHSPWFRDPMITKGLVLYYYSRCHVAVGGEIGAFVETLNAELPQCETLEGKASWLLGHASCAGLQGALSVGIDVKDEEAVIAEILNSQTREGGWEPANVGYYGFGRCYADRVFTACMAMLGLMQASTVVAK
jgi:hypothetical protein